jgi:hypothetical protein
MFDDPGNGRLDRLREPNTVAEVSAADGDHDGNRAGSIHETGYFQECRRIDIVAERCRPLARRRDDLTVDPTGLAAHARIDKHDELGLADRLGKFWRQLMRADDDGVVGQISSEPLRDLPANTIVGAQRVPVADHERSASHQALPALRSADQLVNDRSIWRGKLDPERHFAERVR